MAKEHHCPNDGAQPCNASTSRLHTCGLCNATWEEDLGAPMPAAAVPAASGSKPSPPPSAPEARAAAPVPAASAGKGGTGSAPTTATKSEGPAQESTKPAPQEAAGAATPSTPAGSPGKDATPAKKGPSAPPPGEPAASQTYRDEFAGKSEGLADRVKSAKVKTCPHCKSESLSSASQYIEVETRTVLRDSQTYRGHWWFADSGDAYTPPVSTRGTKDSTT